MYNSEEEIDDIVVKPTNFSTRETLKKQAITTPKSTLNTIQLVNELKNEKKLNQNQNIKAIREEYEFFDEEFQKTTKDLKEKYRDFMKNKNSLSDERKSVYEVENDYEDDFEVLDNPSKANSIEKIKHNYKYDEDYPEEPYEFVGNELPEYGEDVPPEFPTIDPDEKAEKIENQNQSPKKNDKTLNLGRAKNQINNLSFGTKDNLNENKSPKINQEENSNDKSNRIKTANFVVPQKKEKSITPKQGKALDQYTINNYNFFFNENKKADSIENKKKKTDTTPKKQNISVDYGRRNPMPPPKKSALTPHNKREPTKFLEKEDLLNKSDLASVRERPKKITVNRYEDVKRVELPHIRNESSASRPRNLSDESNRYRPRRLVKREPKKDKSQDKLEPSILVQDISSDNENKLSPRLGEHLSTDMNSATNISNIGDKEKESHNSQAKIMLNSIATSTPHKSITSSTKVKSIISEHYFSERIEHLLNVDLRYKSDQEIIVHNNVLRRYLNETKEDLRRMVGKAINSNRDSSNARNTSPFIKIAKLEEDLTFNDNLIQAYIKEAEGLAKTLRKTADLTYLSELDSKIEVIQNKIRKVQREKKEFDLFQKKELYLCFGNNFLEPLVFDNDKNKINKFNQKRETFDVLVRDIKILRKRNKKAGDLIKEQTEHLSEMNERYNKLRDIAIHFGIVLDQKKKKELENMQKKSSDHTRAIAILEKSIVQKGKTYQYELTKFQNELNNEKKKLKKGHHEVKAMDKKNLEIKLQIEELEEIRDKYILSDKAQNENLQNLEDNRFRVTQNETSTMALDTEKDDLDLDGEERHFDGRSSKAKAASEMTDPHLKTGDEIINDDEIELIKKVEEEKEEEERRKTTENEDLNEEQIVANHLEIILDIQQINKIKLDKRIELPDMHNQFQNLKRLANLYQIDSKKQNEKIYSHYVIAQEFKIIQEPTYTMEERPEIQFVGMDRSMKKLNDGISGQILSKNNSMTSSNNYTLAHRNNRKITVTQNSEGMDGDDLSYERSISSPYKKIENIEEYPKQSEKNKAYKQGYKIRGHFEINESEERLEALATSKENENRVKLGKDLESETASTQRLDVRGSVVSNDLTVKMINSQSPPTLEGSPASHTTYKKVESELGSVRLNLDSKPTPTNKKHTIELSKDYFEIDKKTTKNQEKDNLPKGEKEILTTTENPIITETKSSINQPERFKGLSNPAIVTQRDREQDSSIKEVLTLSDLQPIKINTSANITDEKLQYIGELPTTQNTLRIRKKENDLSEILSNTRNKDVKRERESEIEKEKTIDFFNDNIDIDKINFEEKGKKLFDQINNYEFSNGINPREPEMKSNKLNLNFTLQDQPSMINQPRGGLPRRMKIGDNEKKRQDFDLAKKVEKDGNDFFNDLGF